MFLKLYVNKGFECRGRLAQCDNTHFVTFCTKGPWFETRRTPGLFQSQIYFAIPLTSNLQKKSASSRNLEKTQGVGKLLQSILLRERDIA